MPNTPLRIGLVGTRRGSVYGRLFSKFPETELVGCCDKSEQSLGEFQRVLHLPDSGCFVDFDDFLSLPMDAVVIGSPMEFHAPQSIAALDAGFHVLSEVTAAESIEECEKLVDAVRRTGKTYMLAENCVFWPFVQEWIGLVSQGRLGEIIYAECEYLHPIPDLLVDSTTGEKKWRAFRPPMEYCTHSLGPILEITNDRITRAMGLGNGRRILPEGDVGGIDIQVALFQTKNDVTIKMLRSSVAPRKPPIHFYMLQGTKGFIETDREGPGGKGWLYVEGEMTAAQPITCSITDDTLPPNLRDSGHGSAEYGVVKQFVNALLTGQRPALHELRAADLTAPGLIAHESSRQGGNWLDVPSFRD